MLIYMRDKTLFPLCFEHQTPLAQSDIRSQPSSPYWCRRDTMAASYQDRARSKRSAQASLIPPEWRLDTVPSVEAVPDAVAYLRSTSTSISASASSKKNPLLSPRELAITEISDVNVLLHKLASRQLSSLEVTRAFAKRAALLHQLTTCCTEIFFEDAFARAKHLDEHLQRTGETVGPLHGLPVSIKDLFVVEGVDTCIGTLRLYPSMFEEHKQQKRNKNNKKNKLPCISNLTGLAINTDRVYRLGRSHKQAGNAGWPCSRSAAPIGCGAVCQNQRATIDDGTFIFCHLSPLGSCRLPGSQVLTRACRCQTLTTTSLASASLHSTGT